MTLLEYINSEERGFFLPDMGTNGLFLTGYNTFEVYESPQKQLELAKKMDELFEADFIYTLCDGAILSDSLGIKLLKVDFDFPSVIEHPIVDIKSLEKYKVPNPYTNRRMSINLETYRLISDNFNKPLYVSIQGPFTLAVQLAGATHLLRSIIKEPEYVERLLDFTTKVVLDYCVAVEKAGARLISIAEPATVTLGMERFEALAVSRIRRIYDALSCWKSMHICGDTSQFLDLMLKTGTQALSLDQIMDYERVMEKIPEDIVLIGNLDPIDLLFTQTPENIFRETMKLRKKMRPYKNYVCDFGCNCMNDTPVENLQAAIRAGRLSNSEVDTWILT